MTPCKTKLLRNHPFESLERQENDLRKSMSGNEEALLGVSPVKESPQAILDCYKAKIRKEFQRFVNAAPKLFL